MILGGVDPCISYYSVEAVVVVVVIVLVVVVTIMIMITVSNNSNVNNNKNNDHSNDGTADYDDVRFLNSNSYILSYFTKQRKSNFLNN